MTTEEKLEAALADNAALIDALRSLTPEQGFPKCDSRCSSNHHAFDEDNRCDCGMEEIRGDAVAARKTLAQPHPGSELLERLAKAEWENRQLHKNADEYMATLKRAEEAEADSANARANREENLRNLRKMEAQLATAERERDEAREMLEGSVTDATFADWRESADLRVLEADQKTHSLRAHAERLAKALKDAESVGYDENGTLWPDARNAIALYRAEFPE